MIFTHSVGVSPGTTTVALGACPPDEPNMYTVPPVVDSTDDIFAQGYQSYPLPYPQHPIVQPTPGMTVQPLPPQHPMPQPVPGMMPAPSKAAWNPYATESKLRGLGSRPRPRLLGTAPPRWGIILGTGLLIFGAVVGIAYWRS